MLRQALVSSTSSSSRALRAVARLSTSQPLLRPQFRATPAFSIRAFPPAISRWYSDGKASDEKPAEGEAAEKKSEEEGDKGGSDVLAQLRKDLEAKEAEARDWKDKCLRTVADFRNLQDRTQREVKTARDFAIQSFAKDLMDSVDNLDRALQTVPKDRIAAAAESEVHKDLASLYEGIKMTETVLMQTLNRHGLERVDPDGDKFNPNEHEATFMAPQPDKEDNTVFHIQQKGYKLNGRVLRAAKVGVVKNK